MFMGERLAELRDEHGLHQKELASVLGVEAQTVSYYERGKSKPSLSVVEKMAEYFGVSMDYLMGLTDMRISYKHENLIALPKGYPKILKNEMLKHLDLLITKYMIKK
jgi:transcriptional regulator with XRE-family HTH domain